MSVQLISITPRSEWLIEYAARACYDSPMAEDVDGRRRFIRNIIAKGHESVLEHASATFEIYCSRVASHQIVRHRHTGYSMQSQRYVTDRNGDYAFPNVEEELSKEYKNAMEASFKSYHRLISKGFHKEDARYILPAGAMTTIIMSAYFRQWRHFIKIRSSDHAQSEIRNIAKDICSLLKEYAPSVFGDLYHGKQECDS